MLTVCTVSVLPKMLWPFKFIVLCWITTLSVFLMDFLRPDLIISRKFAALCDGHFAGVWHPPIVLPRSWMPPLSATAPGSNGLSYASLQASCAQYLWVPFFHLRRKTPSEVLWTSGTFKRGCLRATFQLCHVLTLSFPKTKHSCILSLQIKVTCLICPLKKACHVVPHARLADACHNAAI